MFRRLRYLILALLLLLSVHAPISFAENESTNLDGIEALQSTEYTAESDGTDDDAAPTEDNLIQPDQPTDPDGYEELSIERTIVFDEETGEFVQEPGDENYINDNAQENALMMMVPSEEKLRGQMNPDVIPLPIRKVPRKVVLHIRPVD